MAWEWSHTHEAYDNARMNLCGMAGKDLLTCWAEWKAWTGEGSSVMSDFDTEKYKTAMKEGRALIKQVGNQSVYVGLADDIWEKAAELRTCDNGGFRAWVCPYGCHTVSFDKNLGQIATATKRGAF